MDKTFIDSDLFIGCFKCVVATLTKMQVRFEELVVKSKSYVPLLKVANCPECLTAPILHTAHKY